MKVALLFAAALLGFLSTVSSALRAEGSGGPPQWIRLETPHVRSVATVGLDVTEKKVPAAFRHDRRALLDLAWALGENVALLAGGGYQERRRTDLETVRRRDRWMLGLKLGTSAERASRGLTWAASLRVRSRPAQPVAATEDPALMRLEVGAALGSQAGLWAWTVELGFRGETNRQFREEGDQEFRRNYGAGFGVRRRVSRSVFFSLEAQLREPYEPRIDTEVRSLRALPGIVWVPTGSWQLSFAAGFSLRAEAEQHRALYVALTYLW